MTKQKLQKRDNWSDTIGRVQEVNLILRNATKENTRLKAEGTYTFRHLSMRYQTNQNLQESDQKPIKANNCPVRFFLGNKQIRKA